MIAETAIRRGEWAGPDDHAVPRGESAELHRVGVWQPDPDGQAAFRRDPLPVRQLRSKRLCDDRAAHGGRLPGEGDDLVDPLEDTRRDRLGDQARRMVGDDLAGHQAIDVRARRTDPADAQAAPADLAQRAEGDDTLAVVEGSDRRRHIEAEARIRREVLDNVEIELGG